MTNAEFSDTFTTLLNSYNTLANFGEASSRREIVLDEYEKSVLLTQALDIIVKSYFDGTLNNQGLGFDDSTRRLVDFSSLIKVASLKPFNSWQVGTFDSRGLLFLLPYKGLDENTPVELRGASEEKYTEVLFILNEKMIVSTNEVSASYWYRGNTTINGNITDFGNLPKSPIDNEDRYISANEAMQDGWTFVPSKSASSREYVIVPINYKEYDREMSKPYAQPLKKLAWRLFLNVSTGFDVNTELIPKHTISTDPSTTITYKIRYVRRPQPIVLEDMPNGLTVDGEDKETPCELNPILHIDILNKAVELAVLTRGGGTPTDTTNRRAQRTE